jgi:hypothetical protein
LDPSVTTLDAMRIRQPPVRRSSVEMTPSSSMIPVNKFPPDQGFHRPFYTVCPLGLKSIRKPLTVRFIYRNDSPRPLIQSTMPESFEQAPVKPAFREFRFFICAWVLTKTRAYHKIPTKSKGLFEILKTRFRPLSCRIDSIRSIFRGGAKMKKNAVLSIVAIFLCFLAGYTAVQVTILVRNWIAQDMSDCKKVQNSNCAENSQKPAVDLNKR